MNEVINEVKALRHKLDKRMEAASEALIRIEAITDLFPEDSEAWEDMAEEAARLRDEIRAEEKIRRSLSLCEFCKLSTEPLCELCK